MDSHMIPLVPYPQDVRNPALTIEFNDQTFHPNIPVYLPWNLSTEQFKQIIRFSSSDNPTSAFEFPALENWLTKLLEALAAQKDKLHPFYTNPYRIRKLDIEAADWFRPGKLGYMKLQSEITNDDPDTKTNWLPGAAFLRGNSVAVLLIVQPEDADGEDEKKVVLTVQPRIAASSFAFTELPAGMVNATKGFTGKAAEEIWEETRIKVEQSELLNMTEFALRGRESKVHVGDSNVVDTAESLEKAMYPSPGGCDESITLYLCQKRLEGAHIKHLENLPTGLRTEGEKIRLKLVPLTELWREGARDGKALAALSLYENIKKNSEMLPPMPSDVDSESREWRTHIK